MMPSLLNLLFPIIVVYSLLWSLIAYRLKRADIADIAWGLTIAMVAWITFLVERTGSTTSIFVTLLVTIWSLRLSIQIFLRNRQKQEDWRYQELTQTWKKWLFLRLFTQIFLFQSFLALVVSLPIIWINSSSIDINSPYVVIGLLIWAIGFYIECISDWQLAKFKSDPNNRGKLLKSGLWAFSRHPNYVGEITLWWGLGIVALADQYGFLALIGPLLITILILFVSGIPMLEKKMRKHPDFDDYASKTAVFVPSYVTNSLVYITTWITSIITAAHGMPHLALVAVVLGIILQLINFYYTDQKSLILLLPLAFVSVMLGCLQEMTFINLGILEYRTNIVFPPYWILALYGLLATTLNSSLSFLNRSLLICFTLGVVGSFSAYRFGVAIKAVSLLDWNLFIVMLLIWGLTLCIIVIYNRSLKKTYKTILSKESLQSPLTAFFDGDCSICSKEMQHLKKSKQTGNLIYASPKNSDELARLTSSFSFDEMLSTMHSIDANGKVYRGVDTLARVYAKSNHQILSILLLAPIFHSIATLGYEIWRYARLKMRAK